MNYTIDNARIQLRKRINELETRYNLIQDSYVSLPQESDTVDNVILLAIVTGFVCALSSKELKLLGFACKLDWGFREDALDGEIVKTILLHELGYTE